MAQLFVTLLFVAIMIGAACLIAVELTRPLVNHPNGFDDWLADQLALANDRLPTMAMVDASAAMTGTMRSVRHMAQV